MEVSDDCNQSATMLEIIDTLRLDFQIDTDFMALLTNQKAYLSGHQFEN